MSGIKASQLPNFLGRTVIVQEDLTGRGDPGDDYREVQGKVTSATTAGLVIQTRRSVEIIEAQHILDVEELTRSTVRRLVRRWIKHPNAESIKQHLVDRHGFPWDLVAAKEISADMLLAKHEKMDHSNLGHNHGEKPPSTRGRKPQIPGQRTGDHDEIEDEVSEE